MMMISNATMKDIPRQFSTVSGSHVPPTTMPSDKNISTGDKDNTSPGVQKPGSTSMRKVEQSGNTQADSVLFRLVEGEASLLKSQEVDEEKPSASETGIDREGLAEMAEDLTTRLSGNLQIKFLKDETTGKDYFQLIEKETGEVIRQYPPDEMLKLAENFQDVTSLLFSSQV